MKKSKTHIYLISPLCMYLILFFFAPIFILFIYSFWLTSSTGLIPTFTLQNYIKIFNNPLYLKVIGNSILIGFITAIICVAASYPIAYAIGFKYKKLQDLVLYIILISLFSNYLVRVYAWKIILGKYGLINQVLIYFKFIKEPLTFFLYSPVGVILTLVFILIPFTILPIYSSLTNINTDLHEAAEDLGASKFKTFYKITFPLSMPGVTTGFIFSFVLAAGDYITPQLVGGPGGLMIGKVISDQFGMAFDWPFGSALAFFTLFTLVMVINIVIWITKILRVKR